MIQKRIGFDAEYQSSCLTPQKMMNWKMGRKTALETQDEVINS
jgi:hypothetical protein